MGRKKMQIEEKACALTLLEKGVCDSCSQKYWSLKRSNLLTKKVSSNIATRDGTKKKLGSGAPLVKNQ